MRRKSTIHAAIAFVLSLALLFLLVPLPVLAQDGETGEQTAAQEENGTEATTEGGIETTEPGTSGAETGSTGAEPEDREIEGQDEDEDETDIGDAEPEGEDKELVIEPDTLDFAYDPQPASIEDVRAAIAAYEATGEKPSWEFEVDAELMPAGWRCDWLEDEETGALYWTFFPVPVMLRAGIQTVGNVNDLQTAIDNADNGDTIVLGADLDGAVLPATLTIEDKSLVFASEAGTSVTLYAPDSGPDTRVTLYAPDSDYRTRHVIVTGDDVTLTFDGVILDGGTNSGGIYDDEQYAGGIFIDCGNLTLHNAVIRNCHAGDGGGVYIAYGCNVTITGDGTLITNNRADGGGGGVFGRACTITVEAGEISDNTAVYGGGICAGGSLPTRLLSAARTNTINITGCKIINNHAVPDDYTYASGSGGGIYVADDCTLNIGAGADISDNDAICGGGVYAGHSSDIIMTGGVIGNNTAKVVGDDDAGGMGGGICSFGDNVTISNAVITGNTAESYGGGVLGISPIITVINSKITGNTAQQGGGIFSLADYYTDSSVEIAGSTVISDNTATGELEGMGSGGGIFMWERSYLTVGEDVIFARNTAPNGYKWDVDPTADDPADNASGSHNAKILTTNFTAPFTNAYNNFDVNYKDGEIIVPAKVTVTYHQDTVGSSPLGSETFSSYIGAELDEAAFSAALGSAWLNMYRPENYGNGKAQTTFPVTVGEDEDTEVNVLYERSPAPPETTTTPGTTGGGDDGGGSEETTRQTTTALQTTGATTIATPPAETGTSRPGTPRPDVIPPEIPDENIVYDPDGVPIGYYDLDNNYIPLGFIPENPYSGGGMPVIPPLAFAVMLACGAAVLLTYRKKN